MDGSRRSPGLASEDVSLNSASGYYKRPSQGFVLSPPVTDCDFLAYSCAAARELHPLPCLRRAAKTRVPKEIAKNENNLNESKGVAEGSQIE